MYAPPPLDSTVSVSAIAVRADSVQNGRIHRQLGIGTPAEPPVIAPRPCRHDTTSGIDDRQFLIMGDAGEGLVDAEARIQERMEELEAERRRRAGGRPKVDPEKVRQAESLKLARLNMVKQAEGASHPVRQKQIQLAIEEIDKRLATL